MRRMRRLSGLGRNVAFGLGLSWAASRTRTAALIVVPLVESLVPAALALVLRSMVNRAVDVVGSGTSGAGTLGILVLASFVLSAVLALSTSLQQFLAQSNLEALEEQTSISIIEYASALDFAYFESPEFHDTFRLAKQNPAQHVHEMIVKCVRSLAATVTIASLLVILMQIEPKLLLYFIPLALPYLWFRSWVAKSRFDITTSQLRGRRWAEYYSSQVTTEDVIPEVRAYNLAPLFIRRLRERMSVIRAQNERSYRLELSGSLAFNLLAVGVVHIALYQVAVQVISGGLTVGDIAIFATAAAGLRTAIDRFVMSIGSLRWHMSHLDHLRRFFALPPSFSRSGVEEALAPQPSAAPVRATPATAPPFAMSNDGLVIDDVTFTYPGAQRPTLDGLSFRVGAGETVALVGRNGSGKSTLVKLASRLYSPDSGRILVSGQDLTTVDAAFVQRQLAVVFQSFGRYNATAGENIAMGRWEDLIDDPAAVRAVSERIGLHEVIMGFPEGYDEMLGRMFGRTSLSGGQWQTLAIARAVARDAPLMILDEPTANLDAEAEYEVFSQFKALARGRSTLLISHRFSTLALADRIVVLDEGRATEQGTHQELIRLGGTYAGLYQMYRVQGEADVWHADADEGVGDS